MTSILNFSVCHLKEQFEHYDSIEKNNQYILWMVMGLQYWYIWSTGTLCMLMHNMAWVCGDFGYICQVILSVQVTGAPGLT